MRFWLCVCLIVTFTPAAAIDLDGRTEFAQRLALNSSVSGRVDAVLVTPGQAVESGQLLLRLDATVLQFGYDIAAAEVNALIPELARTQTGLDKAQELFDRDSLALIELQSAQQTHAIAAAHLAAAEARLARARHRLAQAELRSPIDGIVIEVNTHPGHYVNTRVSDQALLTVADHRSMIATALLPLEQWDASLLGRPARVSYGKQRFSGRVIDIGSRATSGANNHPAMQLVIEFDSDGRLPPGLAVKIDVDD